MIKGNEIKIVYLVFVVFILVLLVLPLLTLFMNTFNTQGDIFQYYRESFGDRDISHSIVNSIIISVVSGLITTTIAFIMAYSMNRTTISKKIKHVLEILVTLPMLLPTITYGFAIIYSFGKNGLLTRVFGFQLFDIYGFNGLLLGYVIYTLPIAFLILNDAFKYVENKYVIVSRLMKDPWYRTLYHTTLRPLVGVLGSTFLLTFVLCFTDFGIPASVGGTYDVIATKLYHTMLGSIPDFGRGSVIALIMLFPSAIGVYVLNKLDKLNVRYDTLSSTVLKTNKATNLAFMTFMFILTLSILSVFMVMFVTPFMNNYPYDMTFTMKYFYEAIGSKSILKIFRNTIFVAFSTAVIGTLVSYLAAIMNARSEISYKKKAGIDFIAMLTNSVPGMVLGLAYLFMFKSTSFKGTFMILILCNVVHFFTTPYLMAKNALSKLNSAYEVVGSLLGDSWMKTLYRVIIPNTSGTLVQMFSYYMVHSMITVSAVIFLVTAKTSVVTSKIKELQHYANFNEIFILSILIFLTNLFIRFVNKYIVAQLIKQE